MRRLAALLSLLDYSDQRERRSRRRAAVEWTMPATPDAARPGAKRGCPGKTGPRSVLMASFGEGEPDDPAACRGLANSNYWGHQVRALQSGYRVIVGWTAAATAAAPETSRRAIRHAT